MKNIDSICVILYYIQNREYYSICPKIDDANDRERER
jgi:hypothetical protein